MSRAKNILKKERKTVEIMIKKYCGHFHNSETEMCNDCSEILEYANTRLDYCPFGEKKHVCSKCPIHCYNPQMREQIRIIMRYSGPKMIFSHPFVGFRHLFHKLGKVKTIEKE